MNKLSDQQRQTLQSILTKGSLIANKMDRGEKLSDDEEEFMRLVTEMFSFDELTDNNQLS